MEEETRVEEKVVRQRRTKNARRFTPEERLRAVRLHLQEGFTRKLVCEELGIHKMTLHHWVKAYQERGEAGLYREASPRPGRRLPEAVREKIVELKRRNRWYGVKRIAHSLQRWFFLKASPETVRQTLHAAGLMEQRPKARRNLTRPRFFERATPNQMWQSDIFTFRLGGKYAYIVAFMDDYSRYIVGFGLFRSPTAEAVIETYRIAVGEYSPPKEMLTDRGRQYTSWRGKSRFATELSKDRVAQIVSRPQHPMTLGKVERFWASLWQEFLVRAQFDSFESAQERLRLWVKYYNHRRPHQGIGGLSPADRFFEIQSELKTTIQQGIEANLLELALRGKPQSPFYLVGRMDGQSVVLKAEKGKLKLTVNEKELTYDLEKGSNGNGQSSGEAGQATAAAPDAAPGAGESAGGPRHLDGASQTGGRDAGDGRAVYHPPAVAGTGDGGDAAGPGAADEPGERLGAEPETAGAAPEAPDAGRRGQAQGPAGETPGGCSEAGAAFTGVSDEWTNHRPGAGGDDPQSTLRSDDGDGRGRRPGGVEKNLLRVGSPGALRDAGAVDGQGTGAAPAGSEPEGSGAQRQGAEAPTGGRCADPDGAIAGAPENHGGPGR
jgi:transposase InsO family protein